MYPYFNNMFPTQSNVFPTQPTQPTQIQYVQDKASVNSCYLPPNSSGIYMDSNLPRFYTKHTDANGAATVKSFDFKETEDVKPPEYVTKAEFEKFKASMKGAKHEPTNDARKQ